ncbi:MAG: ParB/RepB/Spo0J family partition protein [Acidimicrobiales bacterium]
MSRPSGLGRGLGALIPSDATDDRESTYQMVAVTSIEPNSYQPREQFDEGTLDSLTSSVRELGVLQPLLVRRRGDGFELIAGERRLRAAKRAGLQDVPVIIRDVTDNSSLEQALVENLHRQDLNPLEEAAAFQQLVDEFSMTQAQVAKRVGRSRSAVANTLRLLGLPTSVQRLLSDGALSAGHARALLALDAADAQEAMAKTIVSDQLTVRQVEQLLKEQGTDDAAGSPVRRARVGETRDAAVLELEELLSERLDTRVGVSIGAKKGRIAIEFADLDDLERIYKVIAGR